MTNMPWDNERIRGEVDDWLGEADSDTRERARRLLRRCVADLQAQLRERNARAELLALCVQDWKAKADKLETQLAARGQWGAPPTVDTGILSLLVDEANEAGEDEAWKDLQDGGEWGMNDRTGDELKDVEEYVKDLQWRLATYSDWLAERDAQIEALTAERDALRQQLAEAWDEVQRVHNDYTGLEQQLAAVGEWEVVQDYGYTEHLNMGAGKPSKWQRVEVRGRMITIDRNDTGMHAALLPEGFAIMRRKAKGGGE